MDKDDNKVDEDDNKVDKDDDKDHDKDDNKDDIKSKIRHLIGLYLKDHPPEIAVFTNYEDIAYNKDGKIVSNGDVTEDVLVKENDNLVKTEAKDCKQSSKEESTTKKTAPNVEDQLFEKYMNIENLHK